ncbi:MAG: hypothetical protein GXP50_12360 [Deltaproteobacteria bacterium]|nr:hypothetical protein [Deltaproteobacteria bacterium]
MIGSRGLHLGAGGRPDPGKWGRGGAVAVLAAGLFLLCGSAAAGPPAPGWQTLSGRIEGVRGSSWRWAFDVAVDSRAVRIRVAVHPVAAGGVSRVELERAVQAWGPGVERIWSTGWAIETPDGRRRPVVLDLEFTPRGYHHEVVVSRSGGRVDQVHWRLGDGVPVIAHEVGHMLGLYDEYRGGAHVPGVPVDDPASVMASGGGRGAVRARHLERVLDWFRRHFGSEARLVPSGSGHGTVARSTHPFARWGEP